MTTEPRDRRLRQAVKASALWLALQAAVLLLSGDRLSAWLDLRWMPVMAPYVRLAGLALLALALFVHRGVREPRRQTLAVDTLLLLFLGQAALTLSDQVGGQMVTRYEWLCAAGDALLSTALLILRTPSRQMTEGGLLERANARQLAKETALWIAGKGPRPESGLGSLDAVSPPAWEIPGAKAPLMPKPSGDPLAPPLPTASAAPRILPRSVGPSKPSPLLSNEALLALPLEKERERRAPLVPPAPLQPNAATLPPPSPKVLPRSEAVPRLD